MTENRKQIYNNAYNKANYTGVSFRLNNQTEMDVKEMLDMQENIKAYICKLIRSDIKRQKARQRRVIMSPSDKKLHADFQRYPFEVIEDLPFGDHWTAGFAEDLDSAVLLLGEYVRRAGTTGKMHIIQRHLDPDLNVISAIEVNHEIF